MQRPSSENERFYIKVRSHCVLCVEAVMSVTVRAHVAKVGHEADNRDIQRTKNRRGFFPFSSNTLTTFLADH